MLEVPCPTKVSHSKTSMTPPYKIQPVLSNPHNTTNYKTAISHTITSQHPGTVGNEPQFKTNVHNNQELEDNAMVSQESLDTMNVNATVIEEQQMTSSDTKEDMVTYLISFPASLLSSLFLWKLSLIQQSSLGISEGPKIIMQEGN
jgi:hypothetical protein